MFTPGVKAKMETQQEATHCFVLKRKRTAGPDACSPLTPYNKYTFTILIPPTTTIFIIFHFPPRVFVAVNTNTKVSFRLMLLKRHKEFWLYFALQRTAVLLRLRPRRWLWICQQCRSCPRCLKSFMLTVMSAAGGRHSACVRSFLLNHRDIICACLLGYTNRGSSVPRWD